MFYWTIPFSSVLGSVSNLHFATNNILYCPMRARACLHIPPEKKKDYVKISHSCSWAREGAQPQNLVRQLTLFFIDFIAKPKGKGTLLIFWVNKPWCERSCSYCSHYLVKRQLVPLMTPDKLEVEENRERRQAGAGQGDR